MTDVRTINAIVRERARIRSELVSIAKKKGNENLTLGEALSTLVSVDYKHVRRGQARTGKV